MTFNAEAIFSAPIRTVLGEKERGLDDKTFKRLRFLGFSFVVAFIYAAGLFISDFSLPTRQLYSQGLDLLIMFSVILLLVLIRYSTNYKACFYIAIISVGIVIPAGYFAPTGNRTIFLAPVVLIVAYFLLGRTGGVIWTVYMLSAHLISYELSVLNVARLTSVTGAMLAYSSLSLCITSALLFIYEGVNEANERRIAERDRTLRAAYDDINQLNEQLKEEKAGVEKQVEVRTYQLHEEQARLRASIATLELGFLMTFKDSSVITFNPALLRICSLTVDAGSLSIEMIYDRLRVSYDLKAAITACLTTGKSFEAKDIDLGDKFIRIIGSAIHFPDKDEALGVVLLFEDRTAANLLQRSQNEFVAIASHELRTPLTIIQGNLSLVEDMFADKIDPQVRHMLDSIKKSTTRMISIVNQFLTMTRLEQRRTVFDLKPVDVVQLVNETVTNIKPLADQKNLELKVEIAPQLPRVTADAGRCQEVLSNLVSNAIKYTTTGHIDVAAHPVGRFVVIRVSDTGRGMSPDNQKLLFHKFQQATDNIYTREDSHSTGLGLYISKLLVEQMGGSIELEHSAENEGSIFSFKLPIANENAAITAESHNGSH